MPAYRTIHRETTTYRLLVEAGNPEEAEAIARKAMNTKAHPLAQCIARHITATRTYKTPLSSENHYEDEDPTQILRRSPDAQTRQADGQRDRHDQQNDRTSELYRPQ